MKKPARNKIVNHKSYILNSGLLIKKLLFFSFILLGILAYNSIASENTANASVCDESYGDPYPDDFCNCPGGRSCESNNCPGECGVPEPGVYGSQGGNCACDIYGLNCQGNWCNRWEWCCLVCNPGDCNGGPTPTNPPPATNTPGPNTPTNTPNPNPEPQCSVSGPANLVYPGTAGSYTFSATDSNSNMNRLEGWSSPTSAQSWTNIFAATFANTGSYSTSRNWSCPAIGNYYVVCNAYDAGGGQCTGNPFGIPGGWVSCGATSSRTVSCTAAPTPTTPPCAAPSLSCSTSCPGGGNLDYQCSWNAPVGANQYRFQVDDAAGFTSPNVDGVTSSTAYSGALTLGSYYAHVRVEGSSGACQPPSGWSSTVPFAACGTPPPPTVTPVSPTPPGPCTITQAVMTPDNPPAVVGQTVTFSLSVADSPAGCTQDALFSKTNNNVTITSTNPDVSEPFLVDVRCDVSGSTDITGQARYGGVSQRSDTTTIFCGVPTVIQVTPTLAPPGPVTLSATESCPASVPEVRLTWTASAGATDYHIYKCTGAACTPTTEIAVVSGTAYQDTNVVDGTTYRYRARAHRHSDGQYSAYSNTVTIAPSCPTCNISLIGPAQLELLDTQIYSITDNIPPVGVTDEVRFTSGDASRIAVCSTTTFPWCPAGQGSYNDPGPSGPYNMNATGYLLSPPNVTLRAGRIMEGYERCFATIDVEVINPAPWWQEKEGDLKTNGSIFTDIAGGCVFDATCDENLVVYDAGDFPGVPQAGGTVGTGSAGGGISQGFDWNSTGVTYSGPTVDYTYLRAKLPGSLTPQAIGANVSQATLTAGGTEYPVGSGNFYYEYPGGADMVIQDGSGTVNVGARNVIVFANSNVIIRSKIQVTDGTGVFILIAGGNTSVDPNVGGSFESPTPLPDLEGVYYTQGQFLTGTLGSGLDLDQQLHIRGLVAAWDRVVMERDLVNNSLTPAEYFEFGIDQFMYIPPILGERNILWREVAP